MKNILATKVTIEQKDVLTTDEYHKLQGLYLQKLGPATQIYLKDKEERSK